MEPKSLKELRFMIYRPYKYNPVLQINDLLLKSSVYHYNIRKAHRTYTLFVLFFLFSSLFASSGPNRCCT